MILLVRILSGFAVAWLLAMVVSAPAPLLAQAAAVHTQLAARGLPADLTVAVESLAARAGAQGLPWEPLADKAIEGWAKHVPAARIVAAVRVFAGRMGEGRSAVRGAGVAEPDAALIRAAAEALGSGLAQPEIGAVVRAAPRLALAAPALTVAAALRAQGFSSEQAVAVVAESMRGGRTMTQLLDIPQAARAMQLQGMPPGEIGRRILRAPPHGTIMPGVPGMPPGGMLPGGMPPGGMPPPLPRQPIQPPIMLNPMP
ncbi:MAG: hypothetical protein A2085_07305 [Gemmatimonadetes bacterium GWC2_71_10]|nr:MAG: hypothetical protein A2085_07305 [Gemmatimonadetes bacterium GWC2_71_10]